MKPILTKAWAILALLIVPIAAEGGQATPSMLADACAACHGTDGRSPSTIPSIQGKSADYMLQRLKAFKSGEQEGTVMNRIAKGYSDAEFLAIAQFLASK